MFIYFLIIQTIKTNQMKKLIFTCLLFATFFTVRSQDAAKLENDTLYYSGYKFYKGMDLKTGYGSGLNNCFTFVKKITPSFDFKNCPAEMAKTAGTISRVYIDKGIAKVSLTIPSEKFPLSIDLEGAVDKKELFLR